MKESVILRIERVLVTVGVLLGWSLFLAYLVHRFGTLLVVLAVVLTVVSTLWLGWYQRKKWGTTLTYARESDVRKKLKKHFAFIPFENLLTASRKFPQASRADVQKALDEHFAVHGCQKLFGINVQRAAEELALARLLTGGPSSVEVGPLQYDDVDIGEPLPMRCLKNGLWLAGDRQLPFAVLLSVVASGIFVEVVVSKGDRGLRCSEEFFRDLEKRVKGAGTYRGKAISLELRLEYLAWTETVQVHRLRTVPREELILPEKTLVLLERNVHTFIRMRQKMKDLGLSGKKGLLFYGPPGTGKTHTVHYLASQLPGHTTLLITAAQTQLLSAYFRLARSLQPAMIVIEDVDLIANARGSNASNEALLDSLLNEMDGLGEDADILVILTTNRPDQLEPALASRPGRIDQAIEFPLPDENGRAKLIQLYSRGLALSGQLTELIVARTKGASPAFIKELMRRSAQFHFEMGGDGTLLRPALDGALEEMLFHGGSLNLKLLGGSGLGFKLQDQA